MSLSKTAATALVYLEAQENWIRECGQTVVGYVAKYGSRSDPNWHGDGGLAIFAADQAELLRRRCAAANALHELAEALDDEV